ncbi:GNAT family N-acetyltransferase [Clostridium vincentii]|uniref:N-acetyltransferase domain-containing protein n=1 Tax=Clostridium vincentii TaxID=52704 RepID=A0A2T0BDZ2_9CLOT|nr:GNAT family N-acetyltransferase [Clostridium vincentii]PRR82037.1 hypothetical protein CLVI_21020 [Clostridium vincentii]
MSKEEIEVEYIEGSDYMELIKATQKHFNIVKDIVCNTINDIYPNYYPKGAVDFFLTHHSDENIKNAIQKNEIYLLLEGNNFVGTGSVKENEVCRLFVLPQYQGKGYGHKIMDILENLLFKSFDEVTLAASFPAYNMYIKRGYFPIDYHKILTENGDYLCYHVMKRIRQK